MGCKSSKSLQVHPHAVEEEITSVVPVPGQAAARPEAVAGAASCATGAAAAPASAFSQAAPGATSTPSAPSSEPRRPEPRRPKKTLVKASKDGDLALMEELIAAGSKLEELGMWDNTPLLAACAYGQSKAALELIARGANVFAANEHSATSMHYAAVEGSESVVEALVAAIQGNDEKEAAKHQEKVKTLVNPCNAKVYNRHLDFYAQRTPLSSAAESGFAPLVSTLIGHGAEIEAKNEEEEQTALWLACRHARHAAVKALLSNGADVNVKDKKGVSVLGAATITSNEEVVMQLLSHGISDVNDTAGMPLRDAVKAGKKGVAEALLTHGAAVQAPPGAGRVSGPLHAACEKGDEYLVSLLVRSRADPSVGDAAGLTAFDLLRRRNLPDSQIMNLLNTPRARGQDGSTGATGGGSRGPTPTDVSRGPTPIDGQAHDASAPGGMS